MSTETKTTQETQAVEEFAAMVDVATSPQVVAVAKAFTSKEVKDAKKRLEPGSYPVDITIRVKGNVHKGEDTDKAPTSKVLSLATVALLVRRMGIQRDQALALLGDVFRESAELGKDAKDALLEETGVAAAEEQVRKELISGLPRTPVSGRVTADLTVELL